MECQERVMLESAPLELVAELQKELGLVMGYSLESGEIVCLNCLAKRRAEVEEEARYVEDLARTHLTQQENTELQLQVQPQQEDVEEEFRRLEEEETQLREEERLLKQEENNLQVKLLEVWINGITLVHQSETRA